MPENFCSGNDILSYENGKEYTYDYSTKTTLWINDVSEESKSVLDLKAKVLVRSVSPCLYLLNIRDPSLTGESINAADLKDAYISLTLNPVQFRLNSKGELDSNVDFSQDDKAWSRNIKRGILSALQLKSASSLRTIDGLEGEGKKSAVIYETDVLGRCRTTYSVKDSSELKFKKRKSLQRCTLNGNSKTSAVQYTQYKNIPEFYQGRLFVETYECEIEVKKGIIDEVDCEEKSTYKIGSRGTKGVQAIVKQSLKFVSSGGHDRKALPEFETKSIQFEFSDKSVNEIDNKKFNIDTYLNEFCEKLNKGLDDQHSNNFRSLVNTLEDKSKDELYKLYTSSKAKCTLAGKTFSHALIFANTENSFETILKLLDENSFSDQVYITEYPILTALARYQQPGLEFLKRLKSYLNSKKADFAYLRKLYLVYSSLVKSYCSNNDCNAALLDEFSSIFANNLGSNCADSSKKDLVTPSLRAIGNIGFFKKTEVLVDCASNKENSLEVRISAIQSFRRFACADSTNTKLSNILRDISDDTEVRINVFQVLVKCSDEEAFQSKAKEYLTEFFEKETDVQVLTYIFDYAKERGLTLFLNPILSNPDLKERFSVNFKELSWNNFKYRYSLLRDGAVEVDTSVIYATTRTFIPRSIRFNITLHSFGMSINFADVTLRVEGLEDILKGIVIDKLSSEKLVKKLLEKPEKLMDLIQTLAAKLKYVSDKPFVSLSIKVYGSDVFFSELDTVEKLRKLADFIRSPRDSLIYSQVDTIRNMFLVDSRVRQPLMNGFEFNTFMDASGSLLISKKSTKKDSTNEREFNINNFYSTSFSINKRFEVQFNKDNRASLKKKAVLSTRMRVDLSGTKTNSSAVYFFNFPSVKEVPLVVLDGRFYKLTSNSQYKEVTQFSVEQHNYNNCTSQNFRNSFGVEFCLSIKRPKVGSLIDLLKPIDLDKSLSSEDDDEDDDLNDEEDEDDDDDDDDDNDNIYGNLKRPKLTLSGPYHYEITFKNPDLIKQIALNAEVTKDNSEGKFHSTEFKANLKTVSSSNDTEDRLELNYARKRHFTNRGMSRSISLELKRPITNDVRLRALADFKYNKNELLSVDVHLNNHILRELNADFEFSREKSEDNIVPKYKIVYTLESKVRDHKYRKFLMNITPNGKDIKTDFIIEKSDASTDHKVVRIVDGMLDLSSNQGDGSAGIDYNVELQIETKRPSKLHVYGQLAASMLTSNIDLSVEYSNPNFEMTEPAGIKIGHVLDASAPGAKSHVEFNVRLPTINVNHGAKILFEANTAALTINYLEIQINTPTTHSESAPYTIYIGKHQTNSDDEQQETFEYSAGINNFKIDLAGRESSFAKALTKLDENSVVRSLTIQYTRIKDKKDSSVDVRLQAKKNDFVFANIHSNLKGNVKELRKNPSEVSRQTFSAELNVKVLEYAGSIETKLGLEASEKKKSYAFEFDLATENIFRILIKVISINSKVSVNGDKINAEYSMKKLGEVKQYKIASSNGVLKSVGQEKHFDVDYQKTLANGNELKGKGTVKFTFNDIRNFESSLEIPTSFRYKLSAKNKRSEEQLLGYHDFSLNYAHLDAQPSEREINVLINNKTDVSKLNIFTVNFSAKKGAPSTLDKIDQLDYLVDLKSENTFAVSSASNKTLVNGVNSLALKSKQFNIDLNLSSNSKLNLKEKKLAIDVDYNLKFPAIISDPGKLNTLKETFSYTRNLETQKRTVKYTFETDNKLLGKYIKSATVNYAREPISSNLTKVDLNADYVTGTGEKKNLNLKIERTNCRNADDSNDNDDDNEIKQYLKLCSATKIHLKQKIVPEFTSKLAGYRTIDISDCKFETKLVRTKQDKPYSYLLDALESVQCSGVSLINNSLYVSRYAQGSDLPTTVFRLNLQSDIYYDKRSLELTHKKFSSQDGLFELKGERADDKISHRVSYKREVEEQTGKLIKGNYMTSSSFGDSTYKSCELNIEAKTNYYNKLSCKIKTPKIPVELSYGYALKVNDRKELLFGKRDMELNISLPSTRQIKTTYVGSRSTPIDQTDDDNDNNNEREYNGTAKIYFDFAKNPEKLLTINVRRDNYENTNTKFSIDASSNNLKLLKFTIDRKRLFNQTDIKWSLSYEVANNAKNQLDLLTKLSSDLDTNSLSIEANLERPSFNTLYENKFNKLTGRLHHMSMRAGKLLKFTVDKESDPENRRISIELVNPDQSLYTTETKSECVENGKVHLVKSSLKKAGTLLSEVESRFDSENNFFDVKIKCIKTKQSYRLNVGIFNETLANAVLLHESKNNKPLGLAQVNLHEHSDHYDLDLSLKWNRLWGQMRRDILGKDEENTAVENPEFNSYLGDVYSSLAKDLKPSYEAVRKERKAVFGDFKQAFYLVGSFYAHILPSELRNGLVSYVEEKRKLEQEEEKKMEELPLHKRLFIKYNKLASRLTDLHLGVRKYSVSLSKYVPRLPKLSYNNQEGIKQYDNNLVVSRTTLYAHNLYQFNAEYRDYLRKVANRMASIKGNLMRNLGGVSLKALVNKYKYRSLRDYTMVGHVYNKRNIIAFNGESKILKSKCRFLLAHELSKNQFSVILNNHAENDLNSIITISAHGESPIDINAEKAFINNKQIALPYEIVNKEKSYSIKIRKTNNAVSIEVNKDLLVTCYEDSKSCSVALTRWYTGKVNGLLGKSNQNLDNVEEDNWYLGKSCKLPNAQLKKSSEEAIKTCYSIFGKHRKSFFRDSFLVVKPSGWQKICESVLTADQSGKCPLMKAFVHHARIRSIDIDEPNECYQCQANNNSFHIGKKFDESHENLFSTGSDFVFVILPCDKSKHSIESLSSSIKKLNTKYPENKYHIVKVSEDGASIYQSENSQTSNFDFKKAYASIAEDQTSYNVKKSQLYNGLFLAGTIFTNRLAQSRQIIVVSCGNCIEYSILEVLRIEKILKKRNVQLSTWGNYDMTDLDNLLEDENAIGYIGDKVLLNKQGTNNVEVDSLDSYKIEHVGDTCSRLAAKSGGSVFNLNFMKKAPIFENAIKQLTELKPKYKNTLEKCERIHSPWGDIDDITFKRVEVE